MSDETIEGFRAGLAGAPYEDCPYGKTHPDMRFNQWTNGFWKATNQWCQEHNRPDCVCISAEAWDHEPQQCWAARNARSSSATPVSSSERPS